MFKIFFKTAAVGVRTRQVAGATAADAKAQFLAVQNRIAATRGTVVTAVKDARGKFVKA